MGKVLAEAGMVVDLAAYRQQRSGRQKTAPALLRAADCADNATAELLATCELLTAAGRQDDALKYRAVTELALELRSRLPGGAGHAA